MVDPSQHFGHAGGRNLRPRQRFNDVLERNAIVPLPLKRVEFTNEARSPASATDPCTGFSIACAAPHARALLPLARF